MGKKISNTKKINVFGGYIEEMNLKKLNQK